MNLGEKQEIVLTPIDEALTFGPPVGDVAEEC